MADNGTVGSILQNKHIGKSLPKRKPGKVESSGPSATDIMKANEDQSKWEWVEIPDTDLFGEEHTGVSINFDKFTPGKYFVSPELAFEIKRLLANRLRGDMRVLQPKQDMDMARIMQRSQLGAPINSNLEGLNDK